MDLHSCEVCVCTDMINFLAENIITSYADHAAGETNIKKTGGRRWNRGGRVEPRK